MAVNRDAKPLVGGTVFGSGAAAGFGVGPWVVLVPVSASKPLQNEGQDQGKCLFFIHTSIVGDSQNFSEGGVSKKDPHAPLTYPPPLF